MEEKRHAPAIAKFSAGIDGGMVLGIKEKPSLLRPVSAAVISAFSPTGFSPWGCAPVLHEDVVEHPQVGGDVRGWRVEPVGEMRRFLIGVWPGGREFAAVSAGGVEFPGSVAGPALPAEPDAAEPTR